MRIPHTILLALLLLSGCVERSDDAGGNYGFDGGSRDAATGDGDGGRDDDGAAPRPDGGRPDPVDPLKITTCTPAPPPTPDGAVCAVEPGGPARLIVADVLTPGEVFEGGGVLLDAAGRIACVGCDCAAEAAGATRIVCPDAVLSPGLINAHEHIGWLNERPFVPGAQGIDEDLRWEHRHDWRTGRRGHPRISTQGGASAQEKAWGELRHLLGGATAINGSGRSDGLLRNVDGFGGRIDGLDQPTVRYETFPLDDSRGTQRTDDCRYGDDGIAEPPSVEAYTPHVAEGIDGPARNEFLCLTGARPDGLAHLGPNSAIIHGVGLLAPDIAAMAAQGMKLIWSPRSNVSLYGDTAAVTVYDRLGVEIGLGTDWMPSGSMNMLRELRCADELNQHFYGGWFTDEALWRMATLGSAAALALDDAIGVIARGRVGDLVVFANGGRRHHRAVLDAGPAEVALVLLAGRAVAGDAAVVEALETGCDLLPDVCGADKRVCLSREIGMTLAQLTGAVGDIYPLYFCGPPEDEPSCLPARTQAVDAIDGSTLYTGMSGADDRDGDGIPDGIDNCPSVFNPVRPVDGGGQADFDGDGVGDACDPCPLDQDTDDCGAFDADDRDGDGVPNLSDVCPDVADPDQADADGDGRGDACDACPDHANPGDAGCPATVREVKTSPALLDARVSLDGLVVTAVAANGVFLQADPDAAGFEGPAHSGVFAYLGNGAKPAQWDVIRVEGATVAAFFRQIQLTNVTWSRTGARAPLTPVALDAAAAARLAEEGAGSPYEGMVVQVSDVTVTAAAPPAGPGDDGQGEFEITGGLRVDDAIFRVEPAPAEGERFAAIVGPASWRNEHIKLLPRDAADVVAGDAALHAFGPAGAFQRIGAAGPTIPQAITVQLTRAAGEATVVELRSEAAGVAAVDDVTIPAGAASAVVPVRGVAAGTATLTARLGDRTLQVEVRVVGDEQPRLVELTPSLVNLPFGGSVELTVGLDLPAPAGGTTVDLLFEGPISSPDTVRVPADALRASFTVTAGDMEGEGVLLAGLGADVLEATIAVGAGGSALVINEVDYDQPGADAAEFIEIFNGTPAPVPLAGLQLVLVNGSNGTPYLTVDLADAGAALPAGGYLVVAAPGLAVAPGALRVDFPRAENNVQNGDPDGIALFDAATGQLVDALSYEGEMRVTLGGVEHELVEGRPTEVADRGDAPASLCRLPNGADTDDAAADWRLCAEPTPGAANQ